MDTTYHDCQHQSTELRKRTFSNNTVHYQVQCLDCGASVQALKKASLEVQRALNDGGVPDYDEGLQGKLFNEWSARRKSDRESKRAEWFEWYNEYLKSPQWLEKRALVLKNANGICQGCGKRRAAHAHHLTYERVGNEMLFDLVAVCKPCHRIIHQMGEANGQQIPDRRLVLS